MYDELDLETHLTPKVGEVTTYQIPTLSKTSTNGIFHLKSIITKKLSFVN